MALAMRLVGGAWLMLMVEKASRKASPVTTRD